MQTLAPPPSRHAAHRAWLIAAPLAVGALVAWTYGPSLRSYLIADDFQWLAFAADFSFARLVQVSDRTHFYRPVVEMYFAALYAVSGCSAAALHAASVGLHVLNATLAMALAYSVTSSAPLAAVAALLFAVQPAPAEAVLWPSAASALLSAAFGLTMLLLEWRGAPPRRWRKAAVALVFAGALGSHEGAVMLPAAAWLLHYGEGRRERPLSWAREHWPSLAVLACYVLLAAWINSRNYVVTEGRYALGWHMAENLGNYLVALWVGRRVPLDYLLSALIVVALVWKGTDRIRAWALWTIAALLPVLPFTGPTTSRYAYVAAIPFSWLLAAAVLAAHGYLRRRLAPRGPAWRTGVAAFMAALTVFAIVRSATFARKGTRGFHADALPYRQLAATFEGQSGPALTVEASEASWLDPQYLLPLARVARCDPGVTVTRSGTR